MTAAPTDLHGVSPQPNRQWSPSVTSRLGLKLSVVGLLWVLFGCSRDIQPQHGAVRKAVARSALATAGAARWQRFGDGRLFGYELTQPMVWNGPGTWKAIAIPTVGEDHSAPADALDRATEISLSKGSRLAPGPTLLIAPTAGLSAEEGSSPRRIVLVVADTLRLDAAKDEMTFRRRFDDGLRFEKAFSPATWTLPSIASLFVSRPPAALRGAEGDLIVLPPNTDTLAAKARAKGMTTVAIVANPTVNHDNGYSQGFDVFIVPRYLEGWHLPDASWVLEHVRRMVSWFPDRDLFLYLHFMDAHDPYRNHETGSAVVPPSTGPRADALTPAALDQLKTAYRSEIRHLDQALNRLVVELESVFPIDLLIFTADHGEELLDHGGMKHGPTVFPEVANVPLWIGGREAAKLRQRLEGSGIDPTTPVSLTELGGLILDPATWTPNKTATTETLAHGPPRFAWTAHNQHFEVASRWLWPQEPADGIELWLSKHQPALLRSAAAPKNPQTPKTTIDLVPASWQEVPDRLWLDLIEQLAEVFPGRWIFYRAGDSTVPLDNLSLLPNRPDPPQRNGWRWGDCDNTNPRPTICLAFLGSDLPAPFQHQPSDKHWHLDQRPKRLPPAGAVTWLETPHDLDFDLDVQATIERLKAMGYLGG